MPVSPADSQIWHRLYGDAELAQLFTDSAEIRAMLLVEGALATAQGRLGLIPETSAAAIARAAREVIIDPGALAEAAARDGVVVPALVAAFARAMEAPEHAGWIHFGATSQDIQDTGLVLRLRRALDILEARLLRLLRALGAQAERHAETVLAARTRWQVAAPSTLGARIATWGMPLLRHHARLSALRPRLLVLSLGGAAGTRAAFGGRGAEVASEMARELGLATEAVPWHAARDGIAELGALGALIAGTLAKIGQDLCAAALLGEGLSAGAAGGSSTLPQKRNPTGAEALVALSRHLQARAAEVQAAASPVFERDGAAWGQEMLALPGLVVGLGAALARAIALAESLEADPERLRAALEADGGLACAEAAAFHLAPRLGLPEARAAAKAACETARAEGRSLVAVLADRYPGEDWTSVLSGPAAIGEAPQIARAFAAEVQAVAARAEGR